MNSNTIREVLIKIISINKGLNEETMNKLLVASGWENNDVQEGMRIFREINPNKNPTPVSTPTLQPVATTQPVPQVAPNPTLEQIHTTIVSSQPVAAAPAPQPVIKQEPAIVVPKAVVTPVQNPVQIANASNLQQNAVVQSTPMQNLTPATNLNSIKEKLAMHAEKTESQKFTPTITPTPITETPILKDVEQVPEEKGDTPWGFVLFDVFLFLIALGLLIFIFIK